MIDWDVKRVDSQIATFFDQLRDRLSDMTPVMKDIGELMVTVTKQRSIERLGVREMCR
ncbi:hypothetical protein [Yoonia sp.]|uniref:hypothetical protein n=1 Tax=Yoonia sp. TaxID=2212373 RepID=UPI00391D6A8D